jgi:transcriptional regulator with XRE-family HTH domain
MGVGDRLREFRKQAGLTQKQLQERSGVPQNTISRIELDTVKVPSTKTLLGLSRALQVSIESLLGVDESPRSATTAAKARRGHKTRPLRMERDDHGTNDDR